MHMRLLNLSQAEIQLDLTKQVSKVNRNVKPKVKCELKH